MANYGADSRMTCKNLMWFTLEIRYKITNKEGRALAVEFFSSNDGNMTVTPTNEPGAASIRFSKCICL